MSRVTSRGGGVCTPPHQLHPPATTGLGPPPPPPPSATPPVVTTAAADHVHIRLRMPDILPTASPQERQTRILELSRLLTTLREVAKGRPLIDWDNIVASAATDPVEGAKTIGQILQRFPSSQLPTSLSAIAQRINTPGRLAIVAHLDEPYRSKVRDEVLQGVLKALTSVDDTNASLHGKPSAHTTVANPPPPAAGDAECAKEMGGVGDIDESRSIPLASRMMVGMIRLDLVLIKGVATTLDTLLRDRKARKAAVAVIGLLAERYARTRGAGGTGKDQTAGSKRQPAANDEGILPTLNHVRGALESAAADAATNSCGELDYDINAIQRCMNWRTSTAKDSSGHQHRFAPTLVKAPKLLATPHQSITSTAYFGSRDELVTGGAERTIAVWGACNSSNDAPSASFQLPAHTTPVSMDASVRGSLLAVGCVSTGRAGVPMSCVQAYLCSDTGAWTVGDVIRRPDRTVLTNVKCLAVKGSVVCTTETLLGDAPHNHQVALFNASGHETRVFAKAHADCITALGVSPDSDNLIITGSRDTTVRLWDVRSPSNGGSSGAPVALSGHTDTITSIAPVRDVVVTTSLDGTMRVWDVRRTRTELSSKTFSSGVLKAVCTANLTGVVSTLRGVYLVSLMPTIEVDDVLPNVLCTDLRANFDGTVVFGVCRDTIASLCVHTGHKPQ